MRFATLLTFPGIQILLLQAIIERNFFKPQKELSWPSVIVEEPDKNTENQTVPACWKEHNCVVGKTKHRKQGFLSWEKREPEVEPYDIVSSLGPPGFNLVKET